MKANGDAHPPGTDLLWGQTPLLVKGFEGRGGELWASGSPESGCPHDPDFQRH